MRAADILWKKVKKIFDGKVSTLIAEGYVFETTLERHVMCE